MALGKRRDSGNFLPIAKYDARVGTFYLQDRVLTAGTWQNEQRDVTRGFEAVFDLANLRRGWIWFPKGAAPVTALVPAGDDPGDPPSDEHKEGVRVLLKMSAALGGDVRELMSTAHALWNAIDTLHDQYLAMVDKHPGKLPVVTLDGVRETKNASGTAFVPVFKIVDWIPRPPDLVDTPPAGIAGAQRTLPLAAPKATIGRAPVQRGLPSPATPAPELAPSTDKEKPAREEMHDEIPF